MKLALRLAAGVALLVVGLVVAAALALPRLVESDEVRRRIEAAALGAIGRELRYESLDFGLLPPSLRVMGPRISGATPSEEALLEAEAISLRVALLPLLARAVVIDSLVVEGATVRLVRGAEGLELPEPPRAEPTDSAPSGPDDTSEAEGDDAGLAIDLGVRSVQLRDATLHLTDRSLREPVIWELGELELTAEGRSLSDPVALALQGVLGSGGAVNATGTATTAGVLDLEISLEAVEVSPLAAYVEDDVEMGGALSGDVSLRGPAADLEQLSARLRSSSLRFARGDTSLSGAVELTAEIAGPSRSPSGSFEVDATGAALGLGAGFTKPAGVPARVSGRIAAGSGGGLAIDDVRLVIRNFEAEGRLSSLAPLRLELSAPAFDLEGWDELVPALTDLQPSGRLGIEGLRFVAEPQDLRGAIQLEDVVLHPRGGSALTLRGALLAEGSALRSEGATLEVGGQSSQLALRISDLFTTPRYRVGLVAEEADSNELFTQLLAKPDTLYGPLGLDLELDGALTGDPIASLRGRIDFGVEKGRLVGVSLLRAVFDRMGSAGSAALNLGRAFGGRDLQRFYGDEFQLLRGALRVRDGVAHADDLRLEYQGYAVRLEGTLGLADLALDMSGELGIGEELDAAIARELRVADYTPRQRVVPLTRVRGTLDEPEVRVDSKVAAAFGAAYASDAYAGKLREKAEEKLGPGAGDLLDRGLGALEGILGGRSAPRPPPEKTPSEPQAAPES
jgi:uncharacterized protein involved in outer membrane biogenesis